MPLYFHQISTGTDAIPAELKVDAGTLPKSCKGKFYSAASLPSDPEEMKTYIVLLRRYSTSRAALRVAATLERLARNTSGVRLGELSVMDSGGEPSLVVETTVAGLRVVSPAVHSFILLPSLFVSVCGWKDTIAVIPCSDARIFASLHKTNTTRVVLQITWNLCGWPFPMLSSNAASSVCVPHCNAWPPLVT